MKRIIISALILAGFTALQAQEVATPSLNFNVVKKKFDKSNEDIVDAKNKIKAKVWFDRGELMKDIYNVNTEFVRRAMPVSEAQLYLGKPAEIKTNDEGQELYVYPRITLIFEGGAVVDWVETEKIVDNPLPIALEAYMEALRLDDKGKLDDKILKNLDELKSQIENEAIIRFTKKDFSGALDQFELILETSKADVYHGYIDSVVVYNAALAARNAENHKKSAAYFQKAIDINYGGSDAYYFLVREYITLKDSTKALSALQKGFEMYPDTTLILFELVNYYINTGDVKACMTYLNIAEEKDSGNPSIYFAKGTLYEKIGERDNAIKEYLRSLEVDPEFYNSWFNLGAAYFNNAVELYDVANTKEDLKEYNKAKAEADEALKKAIEPMEKAHSLKPDDPDSLETLKTIYYRLGEDEKYQEILKKLEGM